MPQSRRSQINRLLKKRVTPPPAAPVVMPAPVIDYPYDTSEEAWGREQVDRLTGGARARRSERWLLQGLPSHSDPNWLSPAEAQSKVDAYRAYEEDDLQKQFRTAHGSPFDPKSSADAAKMAEIRSQRDSLAAKAAQESLRWDASQPYHAEYHDGTPAYEGFVDGPHYIRGFYDDRQGGRSAGKLLWPYSVIGGDLDPRDTTSFAPLKNGAQKGAQKQAKKKAELKRIQRQSRAR